MSPLETGLGADEVLGLALGPTGDLSDRPTVEIPPQGVINRSFLRREAGLVVIVRPGGEAQPIEPSLHWPPYTRALFGDVPNGGVHTLRRVTRILRAYGSLPVPEVRHCGEGTGPGGRDYVVVGILPGHSFDWETNRMGRSAARQLGDHLGRLHAATRRFEGFGVFGAEPIHWIQWWPRFAASYETLADEVCGASPALRGFRWRLDLPLRRATCSPDPRVFPLVCVDQNPSHYLGDETGAISGFVDIEGHLFAPAEWELTTILMWMPYPKAFRQGYERHRLWPESMDDVRDAYATYTLLEWIRCTRSMMNRPEDASALEAWLIGTLA